MVCLWQLAARSWLARFVDQLETVCHLLCCAGPDRALFLPGGLLDRDDLPDYLDGTLAGE